MSSIPSDRPGDPLGIVVDHELALLDRLLEQVTAPPSLAAEDEQPAATPVFTPGDVGRTQDAVTQAGLVRERMLEEQRRVPRDGTVSSSVLMSVDAQVAKAQQDYDVALRHQKAARDQAMAALVRTREFPTSTERAALLDELALLDAAELDHRWEAREAVERVVAEHERVAAARLAPVPTAPPRGRPVSDSYARAVEERLKADDAEDVAKPDALAEMDRRLGARPGTLSKRLSAHPEQFKGKLTTAWLEYLQRLRRTRRPYGSQKRTSRATAV